MTTILNACRPCFWIYVLLVLFLGYIDYWTGIELEMFIFYFIPIALTARSLGLWPSCFIAVESALVWLIADYCSAHVYSNYWIQLWHVATRLGAMLFIAHLVSQIRNILLEEQKISEALRTALADVKTLTGLLPICAWCKKIKNDNGYWQQLENYISQHSDATFTHGLCEECAAKLLREGNNR